MAKSERILPHNRDAEQSVLGAAMLSREALSDVLEIVRPDDFYDPAHKEIFRVMSDLFRESVNVDIVTVCDELKKRNSLEAAGGRTLHRGEGVVFKSPLEGDRPRKALR